MIILTPEEYKKRFNSVQTEILLIYLSNADLNLSRAMEKDLLMGAFLDTDFQEYYVGKYLIELQNYIKSKL
ncbi:hypothetical protein VWJ25_05570 [Escherichia coli O157]|uniref:Uncharacterized protein n=1 Tax=Escherichia phage vB_Eco_slurp01 TaxID=1874688 RepID=A0A1C3S6B4_9CAUD|nr:hypothetical protein [Escherichia coli]MED6924683.1 hypothetical protein [Escherichia coli O157]SCA80196.1 hypothetical protein PSLUR01_00219 [Escherichia phage vB_Eco_slurp01]EGE5868771.1 hypothetical protein [Escherichia coli]MCV8618487.1 hypothetical protein [Escherichia coli]